MQNNNNSGVSEDEILNQFMEVALHAASEAGNLIAAAFLKGDKSNVLTKSCFTDLVTQTDERGGGDESTGVPPLLTDQPTWMIDPIDGTTNFVHAFPFSCVSIGLAIKKKVIVAVVHNPILQETFTAIRDQGSKLNGKPISVSSHQTLDQALICTEIGTSRDAETLDAIFARIRALSEHCRGIRCCGSCALNLCSVAMGRIDSFYEIGFGGCWDVAAGSLIVTEAGGLVLDPSGDEFGLMRRRVLAGTPGVAKLVANILSKEPISNSEPA